MSNRGIDRAWLAERVREAVHGHQGDSSAAEVDRLRDLLERCAVGFADRRTDVAFGSVTWPHRGLGLDEARSFLRAVESGIADVDEAGYVTLPTVRPKTPAGRYALLCKKGAGVSINLEYLIQVGATAELILDHGWPPDTVDFERGEFDALSSDGRGRVVVAMEAKARVTGPDSLEKLVESWLRSIDDPDAALATNAGRKLRELVRLTEHGRVLVWLVADSARWSLYADRTADSITLAPAGSARRADVLGEPQEGIPMLDTNPYEASLHRPGTAASNGHCSWHGPVSCAQPPVISFRDRSGDMQSGCQRAVDELVARGDITTPAQGASGNR